MAKWEFEPDLSNLPPSDPQLRYMVSTEGRKDDGYDSLRHVLALALEQANAGKGKERHANGKPFDRQPIMEIGRMVGSGYPLGQAMKKAQESTRLPPDRAKAELLGAINYLAAAYLLLDG